MGNMAWLATRSAVDRLPEDDIINAIHDPAESSTRPPTVSHVFAPCDDEKTVDHPPGTPCAQRAVPLWRGDPSGFGSAEP